MNVFPSSIGGHHAIAGRNSQPRASFKYAMSSQRQNKGLSRRLPRVDCIARHDELNRGVGGWHQSSIEEEYPNSALAALPHSQAARDSESYHHEQAPSRSLTSFAEDDEPANHLRRAGQATASSPLKWRTVMLKVSGEALQVNLWPNFPNLCPCNPWPHLLSSISYPCSGRAWLWCRCQGHEVGG